MTKTLEKAVLFLLLQTMVCVICARPASAEDNPNDVFNLNKISTFRLYFADGVDWRYQMDTAKAGKGDYIVADSFLINESIKLESVGVKFYGSATYKIGYKKNPIHVKMDKFKNNSRIDGVADFKFTNMSKDPSMIREVLAFDALRKYMPCPRSNFIMLYINDTLYGIMTNNEDVDKTFCQSRYLTSKKSNSFFDCSPPKKSGNPTFKYIGADTTLYANSYEMKSDNGWKDLANLCDTLENYTEDIEKILNVDGALWMLAFNNIILNFNSYIGATSQDFYAFKDDNGRFNTFIGSLNNAFGVSNEIADDEAVDGSTQLDPNNLRTLHPLVQEKNKNLPLISKLLEIPTYKKIYLAHFKTILEEMFASHYLQAKTSALYSFIRDSVEVDSNRFYSNDITGTNIFEDVTAQEGGIGEIKTYPGLLDLMNNRLEYLKSLDIFNLAEPKIEKYTYSFNEDRDSVYIFAEVSNATSVVCGFRGSENNIFIKRNMLDDGAGVDALSGDNIFALAVSVDELNGDINNIKGQFYVYAENEEAGIFSPRRAEYEFHEINSVPNVFNLELAAYPNATFGKVTGADKYNAGSIAIIEAVPANACNKFINWTTSVLPGGDVFSIKAKDTIVMMQNITLTAVFEDNIYDLVVIPNNVSAGEVTGSGKYACGDKAIIVAKINSCSHFINWTDAAGNIFSTKARDTINVTKEMILTANFKLDTFDVKLNVDIAGAGEAIGSGKYVCGNKAIIAASAKNCYKFVSWTDAAGNVFSTKARDTINLSGNLVLTANFKIDTYFNISLVAEPGINIGGTVTGGGEFGCGEKATIKATAYDCYSFVNWTDAISGDIISYNTDEIITVDRDMILVANFILIEYTLELISDIPAYGEVVLTGGDKYGCQTAANISVKSNACYKFINWTNIETGQVVSSKDTDVIVIGKNLKLKANFDKSPIFVSIALNNVSAGEVTGSGYYECNTIATLVAEAKSNFKFVCWTPLNDTEDTLSKESIYKFTVSVNNKELLAHFDPDGGIDDELSSNSLIVFPNPANATTKVSLDLLQSQNIKIVVCDVLGNEVVQVFEGFAGAGLFQREFSVAGLPIGIYCLQVLADASLKTAKLVVNN